MTYRQAIKTVHSKTAQPNEIILAKKVVEMAIQDAKADKRSADSILFATFKQPQTLNEEMRK